MKPQLSVIMPTYNGASYIRYALDSICAQEGNLVDRLEVLIVDDGSTDQTMDIISEYTKQLPITIIRSSRVGNWVKGLNEGLTAARGEFCCQLHQDDAWAPTRLKKLFYHIETNPSINAFIHNSYFMDNRNNEVGSWDCPFKGNSHVIQPGLFFRHLLVQDFICINTPTFRTRLIAEIGLFDDNYRQTTDWDFWLKLFGNYPAFYIKEPLSFFRIHSKSQTVANIKDADIYREQLDQILKRHSAKLNLNNKKDRKILTAAHFSNSVNTNLGKALYQHSAKPLLNIINEGLRLSPAALAIYIRDSRILERLGARIRVRKTLH